MRNNRLCVATMINVVSSLLVALATLPATAQNSSVRHTFRGSLADGSGPYSALAADSAGNLYGTTRYGGIYDFGTVYELPVSGGEKILHHFSGSWDGAYPNAEVILDALGNILRECWVWNRFQNQSIGSGKRDPCV